MNFEEFNYTPLIINNTGNNSIQDIKFSIVPTSSYLDDTRLLQDFKKLTFDNHKKTDAMKQFEQSCLKSEIEKACYWGYQLLACGSINQIWEKCYSIIYKNINIQNPNSPEWLLNKEKLFRKMVSKKEFTKDAILYTRNIQQIRNILTELIVFICLSDKRKLETLNFKFKDEEFDLKIFNNKSPHKHTIEIKSILGPNDSKEIVISGNELYFAVKNKNIQEILYWITWIYNWEKINIKKYKQFHAQARSIEGIDTEHQRDVSWFIWSVIQFCYKNNKSSTTSQDVQLNSLWLLYIFNWKPSHKNKKIYILIWYTILLISPFINYSIPIIQHINTFIKVISNVNLMFQKIKIQGNKIKQKHEIGNNINILIENNYK